MSNDKAGQAPGFGADTLIGGDGADVFVFNALDAADTATGFVSGYDSRSFDHAILYQLDRLTFNADNFVAGTATVGANDFVLYDRLTGTLYYDADGIGVGTTVAVVQLGIGTVVRPRMFQSAKKSWPH